MDDFKMFRPLALLAPVLALGCAAPSPAPGAMAPATPAPVPPGECAAGPARELLGKTFDGPLQAEAQRLSGARIVRVIRPGQAVTMDFNAYRLNIELDARDRVKRLHCG